MANYLKKEISDWNTKDLCSWLIDNKYPGISELCQNNSLSGYDLFFINDTILKQELNLSSFHERKVTMKLINKLVNEHLKLTIINSNGDSVILTLDNNHEISLGDLSEYIGRMFNMEPKDILYKDNTKKEVLSPTLKIVKLLILYPHLYKTLNVFNMKDYHQINSNNENEYNDNDNIYQKNVEDNNMRNNISSENDNESENQEMNFNYKINNNKNNMDEIPPNRIIYNMNEKEKMNELEYNNDYDMNNMKKQKYRSEQRIYRANKNEVDANEKSDDVDSDIGNERNNNNDLNYRNNSKYQSNTNKLNSMRNQENNNENYQRNYNKAYNNINEREDYYKSGGFN